MATITYQNLPSTSTPLNATNLNAMQDTIALGSSSGIYYMKFDSGILITYTTLDKTNFLANTSYSTTAQGINWYRSEIATISFPVNYVSTNYSVSIIPTTGISGTRFYSSRINSKTTSQLKLQLIDVEDFTSNSTGYTNLTSVDVIVIGRWK